MKTDVHAFEESLQKEKLFYSSNLEETSNIAYLLKSYPKASVVIINAFSTKWLNRALNSLMKNTHYPNYEIVIVDCMTPAFDKWIKKIKSMYPTKSLKHIHLDYDIGASAEHNIALKAIDEASRYVVFLDNDTEIVDPYWLDKLIKALEITDAVVVSPLLVAMENPELIQYMGGYLLPDFVTNYALIERSMVKTFYEVFSFSGAAFVVKKSALDELAKFGLPIYLDFFFICRDDLELSIRLRSRGYRILTTSTTKVAHKGGNPASRDYHYLKNSIAILLLHANDVHNLIKIAPYSTCSLLIHELLIFREFRVNVSLTAMKVFFWFLSNLKELLIIRRKLKKYKRYDGIEMLTLMNKLLTLNRIELRNIKSRFVRHFKNAVIDKLRPKRAQTLP